MNPMNKTIKTCMFSILAALVPLIYVRDMVSAGWMNNGNGYSGGNMMGTGYGNMMGQGYMGWFMIIFWGLLLIAVIFLVRWIINLPEKEKTVHKIGKAPLDILQERLARGEIDINEFREKKQLISKAS